MPRVSSTRLVAAASAGAVAMGVTACGTSKDGGPSSSTSGTRLRSDAHAVLEAMAANAGVELTTYTVTENATTDIRCGDGKAKRTFSARQIRPWKGTPTASDMHGLLSAGDSVLENADRGYRRDTAVEQQTGPTVVSWPLVSAKSGTYVTLTARQGIDNFTVMVTGRTDCVSKG
jgi:hypothetical protein